MRVFMLLAADGVTPDGFFPSDIYGEYPGPAYPDGVVEITAAQRDDAVANAGRRRWNAATSSFDAYAPPPAPVRPREASSKQVRYALNILGVRAAWNAAVAKAAQSNPEAQDYWDAANPMREDNAKVVKWCAAAGTTPKQLFDVAVTQ